MGYSDVFLVSHQRDTMILAPLRNISSLAEDEVQSQWGDIVSRLERPDVKHVIFDFGRVSYFGSSMLEAMLSLWKRIRKHDGKMAVCNVSTTASEILRLSKFDTIWPIHDSLDDALDYVNAA